MSIKALKDYTRYAKYAKYDAKLKRRETWEEQVDRVFKMHEQKFSNKIESINEEFNFAKEMVLKKRILGSQRALQFGGKAILDKEARIYNCTVSYCDRPKFFQEALYLLLCGCGVGFSVQKHHIEKLPNISKRDSGTAKITIPDTIEGWADALGALLSSYFVSEQSFKEYNGKKISFDFSQIRKKGTPLSWGGKAPGPDGLKQSLEKIEQLLDSAINKNQ
jgi:ribonucleoside-diphosphate reductase alpha chain